MNQFRLMMVAAWIGFLGMPVVCNAAPKAPSANSGTAQSYVVDDFKDGELTSNPNWWSFGNLSVAVGPNTEANESQYVGKQALRLQGRTNNFYVGGCGTYLALDGSLYNTLELIIYSPSSDSGRLMVELYDDDNRNFIIEPSPFVSGYVAFDDKFTYEFPVNWVGWKKMTIPLFMFYDANTKIGDDIWNPDRKNGSGGLIQMQLIANSVSRKGKVDFKIDSIRFYNDPDSRYILPKGAEILDEPMDENIDMNIEYRR